MLLDILSHFEEVNIYITTHVPVTTQVPIILIIFAFFSDKDNSTCTPNQFKCNNGKCIDYHLVCNKESDCEDDSDEPLHCNVDECAKVETNQCGHKCVDTLTGYYCECNTGYK